MKKLARRSSTMLMLRRHCFTPRRLGLALCAVGFVWGVMLMNLSIVLKQEAHNDPQQLQDEILQLSEKYVRMLSRDTRNVIDGPYAGRLTGYDLKKTMAVLLENLIDRVNYLEDRLNRLSPSANDTRMLAVPVAGEPVKAEAVVPTVANNLASPAEPVNARDLLLGAQEECGLTVEEASNYPHCKGKMAWMNSFWKSDKCYAENGVDGTTCSFRFYLSEVESWCPSMPNRVPSSHERTSSAPVMAEWNFGLDGLLGKLRDPGGRKNYEWMRERISRTWPMWLKAAHNLSATPTASHSDTLSQRNRKRILVHLGLLSSKSGFHIAESAQKGGPLGELVQWSDIVSSLYVLGHELTITSEVEELSAILDTLPNAAAQCQTRSLLPVDMIYTDIVGLVQFKRKVRNGYGKFSCLLRIIDSFGTEPSFNFDVFAKSHHMKTQWGMQNLNPQQFFTMFPHSPDNSFMGFVVEQHADAPANGTKVIGKKNQAVVYGKAEYMWSGKESYLSIIRRYVDIHATVFLESGQSSIVPSYVNNHGILSGPELHRLLRESKLFIGLGFPYEGPAPLEAIAQGCVFINPKFNPPHNGLNTKFFSGKPTLRKVTSQHPYAEDFIGEPHVFTVDIDNAGDVENAVQLALKAIDNGQVSALMPYEFTHEGMLLRLSAYIQHQDFCSPRPEVWPAVGSVSVISSPPGLSCKDACWAQKMICEPSHLKRLNSRLTLDEQIRSRPGAAANDGCSSVEEKDDIYFPAFEADTKKCFLQRESMLYSCVGEVEGLVRVCSCRDYIRGQTALCANCL